MIGESVLNIMSSRSDRRNLVVGLGMTGLSVVRYLIATGEQVVVSDSRDLPPFLKEVREHYPEVRIITGRIPYAEFADYDQVIVSPGINVKSDVPLIGDIELFAREVRAPVIAITGSNGKSTVTMLVTEMLKAAGLRIKTGGNIGTPALELLDGQVPDFYVLELSSFQLESTYSLEARVAVVLNISEDHMDRYASIECYTQAKYRIFNNARSVVLNRDQKAKGGIEIASPGHDSATFGLDVPETSNDFGISKSGKRVYFSQGSDALGDVEAMQLQGEQNRANVLAAMALVQSAGVALSDRVIAAALEYPGLPHRCEFVGKHNGVKWINDSKGTNVGATSAAIRGLEGKMILLAGGQSKGADFAPLTAVMRNKVVHAILFGEDANRIGQAVRGACPIHRVDTLKAAVLLAKQLSSKGQSVLFSPACASFDMFQNYQHRGERFKALVKEWVDG